MSRIGKQPVLIPAGVVAQIAGQTVQVKGAKGEITLVVPDCIGIISENNQLVLSRLDESRHSAAMFGTIRNTLANMVAGVSQGYRKELAIEGVGYKAQLKGATIVLSLGYSHEIIFAIPAGIKVEVQSGTAMSIEGIDKQLVGQVAARIRSFAPAEPYKGKGVRYKNERVRRKEGKAVA